LTNKRKQKYWKINRSGFNALEKSFDDRNE